MGVGVYRHAVIGTDSLSAVDMVMKAQSENAYNRLLLEWRVQTIKRDRIVEKVHIYRKANKVVDTQ